MISKTCWPSAASMSLTKPPPLRRGCRKLRSGYVVRARRRQPKLGGIRRLGEVFLKIGGQLHYLWRAADKDAEVRHNRGRPYHPMTLR